MSLENAKQFLLKTQADPKTYDRLPTMDGSSVLKLAADMGYPCRLDDLKSVLREAKENSQSLSDKDLEAVAGGASAPTLGMRGSINSIKLSCSCLNTSYPTSWDQSADQEIGRSPGALPGGTLGGGDPRP